MTYQHFQEAVISYLYDVLDAPVQISIQPVLKNNHLLLDGLIITEQNCNISPTIYLNQYYEELLAGSNLQVIQTQILNAYLSTRPDESIDVRFYTDYQNISDKILYKLIHAKENEELLKEVPHIRYLDLAIVFYCLISTTPKGSATILIRSQHLNFWKVSVEDLYQKARLNTPLLLKADIRTMNDIMNELLDSSEITNFEETDVPSMYILTNEQKLYGASCILYPGILHTFAEKLGMDVYILPSSIHEVILLPAIPSSSIGELNEMVRDVNGTQVLPEEILSDHIYLYSIAEKSVLIPDDTSSFFRQSIS